MVIQYIDAEVDPIVEMCTITKKFDNSNVIVANNIKGFPGGRMISNLYSMLFYGTSPRPKWTATRLFNCLSPCLAMTIIAV